AGPVETQSSTWGVCMGHEPMNFLDSECCAHRLHSIIVHHGTAAQDAAGKIGEEIAGRAAHNVLDDNQDPGTSLGIPQEAHRVVPLQVMQKKGIEKDIVALG